MEQPMYIYYKYQKCILKNKFLYCTHCIVYCINCIPAKSTCQIYSLKDEYTLCFLNFLIIGSVIIQLIVDSQNQFLFLCV